MPTYLIRILHFCISFLITITVSAQSKEDFNIVKKVQEIQTSFEFGNYPEVISLAESFLKHSSKDSIYRTKINLFIARAHYATLSFDKATKKLTDVISQTNQSPSVYNHLHLINYYNETADYNNASLLLSKLNNVTNDSTTIIELELQKLTTFIGLYNFIEAENKLNYLTKLIGSLTEQTLITYSKGIFKSKTEQTNQLRILKAKYYILNGNYQIAESFIETTKKELKAEQQTNTYNYLTLLELEAELALARQEYSKSITLYKTAYETSNASDYQQAKINLLRKITCLSSYFNDITSYDQYTRRLQLHADRSIYKYNFYQLSLLYADAYTSFVKSDYISSLSKLDKISVKYPNLPKNHFINEEMINLKKIIYEESGQTSLFENTNDSLVLLKEIYTGKKSLSSINQLLKNFQLKLYNGSPDPLIEKELLSIYATNATTQFDTTSLLSLKINKLLLTYYLKSNQFQKVFFFSDKVTKIAKDLYGQNSWEYITIAVYHIENLILAGDYKNAQLYYSELPNYKVDLHSKNNTYQYTLFLANGYLAGYFGDIINQNFYLKEAFNYFLKETKNHRPEFLSLQENVAANDIDNFKLNTSTKLLQQVLKWKTAHLGNNHPDLLSTHKIYASYHLANGNYSLANKSIAEYGRISSLYHQQVSTYNATYLTLLANYNNTIGDFGKAKLLLEECLKIQIELIGENSIFVANTYLELAKTNSIYNPSQFIENEKYLTKAGEIISNTIGTKNQRYANYLQVSAEFYITFARYNKALENLTTAEKYWKEAQGITNIHIAEITALYAKIAYAKTNYSEAETYYVNARNQYAAIQSKAHPNYAFVTAQLAKVYYMENKYTQALEMMEVCIPAYLAYIEIHFPSLSFQEKSKFWYSMKPEFEFYNFLILNNPENSNTKLTGAIYNNTITTKALLLSSDIKIRKQIATSGDTILINLFEDWVSKKETLTSTLSYSKEELAEQGIDLKQLTLQLEQIEKEMGERSTLFKSTFKSSIPKWQDVQAQLGTNDYAIEIIRYRYFDKQLKDSILYAALILTSKSKEGPELVKFPNGKDMENRWLVYNRNSIIFNMEDKLSYEHYWAPIKKAIPNDATIYLSSDGVFNQLNAEMFLNPTTNNYVLDENQLIQVTNTKDIIPNELVKSKKKEFESAEQIVLCGNPKFYTKGEQATHHTIANLIGAESEVKGLDSIITTFNKPHLILLNEQIIEDSIVQLKNPKILHIATHGYFKESIDKNERLIDNPLLNSGLLLTNAGDIIDDPSHPYVNVRSGILTAYEVTNMTLDKTEVVVLSACETGRGKVQAGEGVFGLQRSFLVAGANSIVISLFKVNDEVTKELMMQFYTNWLQSNDKRTAFIKAKKTIKERYKLPIYWGAFIMIEGKNTKIN